ncbi:MAG: hypothetical protein QXV37_04415 [Candidatus Jordarchaeaceae archaeon]
MPLANKATSIVRMAESLKIALEKGWQNRALLLADGIRKIAEILETEIENIQSDVFKIYKDLTINEAQA